MRTANSSSVSISPSISAKLANMSFVSAALIVIHTVDIGAVGIAVVLRFIPRFYKFAFGGR